MSISLEAELIVILRQEILSKLNNDKHAAQIIFELADKITRMERTIDLERDAARASHIAESLAHQQIYELRMQIRDLQNKLTRAERGHPTRYRR